MAKQKVVKFESNAEGPITIHVYGRSPIQFEPGKVRTYETDDPREVAALRANSDVKEAKS